MRLYVPASLGAALSLFASATLPLYLTNGLPINAGTYTIKASIAAKGNYAAADSTNTLTLTIVGL